MSVHPKRRLAALAIVPLALGLSLAPAAAVAPVPPADAALDWLAGELAANDGMLTVTFGTDVFPDPGLTIDAILAERAGGHGTDPVVLQAVAAVDDATLAYVTQGSELEGDRAANATAKALLLQEVLGADLGADVDLETDLRSLMATDGDEVGRFNDTDLQGFGNYANGLGQALGVLALDRTAGGAPVEAVELLTSQQCPDGSFRIYYFGYVTSFDPYETVEDLTCIDAAEGDVDATALALQALLVVPPTPGVDDAIDAAVAFLVASQDSTGGFFGTGAVNANTTGLAGQALRAAGATAEADAAAGFLAGLQAGCGPDLGAIAYDATAAAAGVDADRDQWIRATAQGVLGLGLPAFGAIGVGAPVAAGLAAVGCADAPPGTPAPPGPSGAPATPTAIASSSAEGSPTLPATGAGLVVQSVAALALLVVGRASILAGRRAGGRP
ncbi:MAG: hypothetical protein ABIP36_05885 [Acidimicrobiales bacterium]